MVLVIMVWINWQCTFEYEFELRHSLNEFVILPFELHLLVPHPLHLGRDQPAAPVLLKGPRQVVELRLQPEDRLKARSDYSNYVATSDY